MSLGLHCYRQTKDIQEKIAGLNSKISTRDTFCVVKIWKPGVKLTWEGRLVFC
jgi:hypothetical protein